MSVSPEDRALSVALRRHVAKSALDISELIISCSKGIVELNGTVKPPRNTPGEFNARKEFQVLKSQIQNVRGVLDVYADRVRIFD